MSKDRPLQELSENLEGSLCRPQRGKWKRRSSCSGGLDTENTPNELIQQWSPPHKKILTSAKGKENEENAFVLARRPRKRRESAAGLCWDSLPDELLLGILSRLSLQDLLRTSRVCKRWHCLAFDESLWHSVDLVGKAQLDAELGQVLSSGALRLRCPHTCIGQPSFKSARKLRVQHLDLSNCTVETSVLEDILSRCRHLQNLSLEGLVLSDSIIHSLAENTEIVRLNLCGCSGFSPESLAEMLKSCTRIEEMNVSWCDFSNLHVQAIAANIPSSVSHLNISGYRQNLTMEDVKAVVKRCPNLTNLDLRQVHNLERRLWIKCLIANGLRLTFDYVLYLYSDSVLVTTDSFPVLQQLSSLRHLAVSRCYQIHPASLIDFEKFLNLQTLEVFGLIQDSYLPILCKGLPHIQINTQPFSTVARPTSASRKDRTLWGMHCRLVYKH
ncbi:S-phase kinase-associated protein 2-like isoform X3 [Carassius carassius]|uniref:S-phase kinase-associated protein 2-like isoform X3 n=1 Tax=Carassius carassius TaxID=217509 RepID=UPI0028689E92|nr:S-phase kinase-associated protein 2-like isoform X3 [Carassius carassius]